MTLWVELLTCINPNMMRLYERAERIIWRSVEYNKINMVNSNAIQPKKKKN